jgi:hypothetical protein
MIYVHYSNDKKDSSIVSSLEIELNHCSSF